MEVIMCPWYDAFNQKCKLTESYMGGTSTQKQRCENSGWRHCGNAEEKANGSNYQNKP
jgi:hypothetical protein